MKLGNKAGLKTNKKMNRSKAMNIIPTGWSVDTGFKLMSVETCQSRNISALVAIVTRNGSSTIAHVTSLNRAPAEPAAIETQPHLLLALYVTDY